MLSAYINTKVLSGMQYPNKDAIRNLDIFNKDIVIVMGEMTG
jgi:hypothetical protein